MINLESLRLTGVSKEQRKSPVSTPHDGGTIRYIKGPVPLQWMARAGQLPGKAIHVGIALWFLSGVKRSREFKLSYKLLEFFDVDRYSAYRALLELESEGLITTERHSGRSPIVTLLEDSLFWDLEEV